MEKESMKNYGNPTLGEIADFIFILLGSFCEENGFGADLRKKYIQEPSTEFRKHHFYDRKSEMSKLIKKFEETIFGTYKAWSVENSYFLDFPKFLVSSITFLQHTYSFPKNWILQPALAYFFGYVMYMGKTVFKVSDSVDAIVKMIDETYADILKSNVRLNFKNLSETAKWGTVKQFLDDIQMLEASEKEKSV